MGKTSELEFIHIGYERPSVHHLESMPFQMYWHEISQDKQKIYENSRSASYHVCMAHEFDF